MTDAVELSWGHININVSDLDRSIEFYSRLGFTIAIAGIPYLGLERQVFAPMHPAMCEALGVPTETRGRACIMRLGDRLPMIDLIQLDSGGDAGPLHSADTGLVRLCLATRDLTSTVARLRAAGVEFVTQTNSGNDELADVALCRDPDGTLVELIQIHLERWAQYV